MHNADNNIVLLSVARHQFDYNYIKLLSLLNEQYSNLISLTVETII